MIVPEHACQCLGHACRYYGVPYERVVAGGSTRTTVAARRAAFAALKAIGWPNPSIQSAFDTDRWSVQTAHKLADFKAVEYVLSEMGRVGGSGGESGAGRGVSAVAGEHSPRQPVDIGCEADRGGTGTAVHNLVVLRDQGHDRLEGPCVRGGCDGEVQAVAAVKPRARRTHGGTLGDEPTWLFTKPGEGFDALRRMFPAPKKSARLIESTIDTGPMIVETECDE